MKNQEFSYIEIYDSQKSIIGKKLFDLIEHLFPICRSITGNGVRDSLKIIGDLIPLDVKEIPTGAKVLGIDPSGEYINLAKKHANENTNFEKRLIGEKGNLDSIPDNSADFVFMSDALLFYFVPFSNEKPDISILFDDIKRILKPNGTFISLEPHYIFWLLPWLGDKKNPFTILTEYNEKFFGVTPTLSKLIQSYNEYGLAVSWMEEIYPDIKFKNEDPRAYYFGAKFPLWHLFELKSI